MKAFPIGNERNSDGRDDGMDLRDYFAAKVIQALMSNYKYDNNWEAMQFFDTAKGMSEMAYLIADEMMMVRYL